MRAYVHCFGRHLQAKGWDQIMIGSDEAKGQLPTTADVAYLFSDFVKSVGCGTAASCSEDGTFEAEVIARHLATFSRAKGDHLTYEKIHQDKVSLNTAEEIREAVAWMLQNDLDTFIGVTSPSHMPRCMSTAETILPAVIRRIWVPSQTFYEGDKPGGTVVLEYPHLPSDPLIDQPMNAIMAEFFRVPNSQKAICAAEIQSVIRSNSRHLNR